MKLRTSAANIRSKDATIARQAQEIATLRAAHEANVAIIMRKEAEAATLTAERDRLKAQRDELFYALVAIAVNPQDAQAVSRAREVAGRNGHFPDAEPG